MGRRRRCSPSVIKGLDTTYSISLAKQGVAGRLRMARQACGAAGRAVASHTGIHQGYLLQMETETRPFQAEFIIDLARIYGLDPVPLLREGLLERICFDAEVVDFLRALAREDPEGRWTLGWCPYPYDDAHGAADGAP